MGVQTKDQIIKSAIKNHLCSWCGTKIKIGESYVKYRYYDYNDASTVKEHPECFKAMMDFIEFTGDDIEFSVGENNRGCNCGRDGSCTRCYPTDKNLIEQD